MLPLIIVNPKSAAGSTRDKWSAIASDLRTHFGPFNVAFTKGPGDGTQLAKRGVESGRKFIIACGGDGTINEIANGVLETGEDVELGSSRRGPAAISGGPSRCRPAHAKPHEP